MTNTEKKTLLAEFEKFLNIQTEELTVRRSTTVQTDEYEVGDIIDFTLKTGEEVSAMLKLTLVSNGCGLATDHEGHLFIFEDAELKKNGERLEKCDGIIVHLKDLVG